MGLSTLAIAQPILGAFNPGFFIAHRAHPLDLVALSLVLVLSPPALLLAVEEFVRRLLPRVLPLFHTLLVGMLGGCAVSQTLISRFGWTGRTTIWVLAGLGLAGAYWISEPARLFATILAGAPVLVLVSFLALGPNAAVVFPKEASVVASVGDGPHPPVVLVIFDELPGTTILGPDGHIAKRSFPHFAALAKEADWYPNASTVHNLTELALPAVLSGKISARGSLPNDSDHPRSLFTLLGDRYEMRVSEPYTQVCPTSVCRDFAAQSALERIGSLLDNSGRLSAQRYLPGPLKERVPRIEQWRDIGGVPNQVRGFKRLMRPAGEPTLYVLHVVVPHRPWRYIRSGQLYSTSFEDNAGFAPDPLAPRGRVATREGWPLIQQYQRHVVQSQHADTILGQLTARMKATGLWDRSVLVVTADHGEAFRPGQPLRRRIVRGNAPDVLSVPMFVKAPGQRRGRALSRFASTVDVVPTIADLAGVDIPWDVDGVSLASAGPDRRSLTMHSQTGPLTVGASWFRSRLLRPSPPRAAMLEAERQHGDPYAMGPSSELLGRRVSSGLPGRAGASVQLVATPNPLPPIGQDDTVIPIRLGGKATGVGPNQALAVAVDDRIVATTRTFRSRQGGISLTALLPPDRIAAGGDIQILRIEGDGAGPHLSRLSVAG